MCICKTVLHVFKLLGVCVWIGTRICDYYAQIIVHIYQSYFSIVDHVIHICDHLSLISLHSQRLYSKVHINKVLRDNSVKVSLWVHVCMCQGKRWVLSSPSPLVVSKYLFDDHVAVSNSLLYHHGASGFPLLLHYCYCCLQHCYLHPRSTACSSVENCSMADDRLRTRHCTPLGPRPYTCPVWSWSDERLLRHAKDSWTHTYRQTDSFLHS